MSSSSACLFTSRTSPLWARVRQGWRSQANRRPSSSVTEIGWHQIELQRLGLAVPEGHWAGRESGHR